MKKPKWRAYFRRINFHAKPWLHINRKVLWKDKYNTPRLEVEPKYFFSWLWWELYFVQGYDSEWEWYLWVTNYHNNNIESAKNDWGWHTVNPDGSKAKTEPWATYNK